MRAATNAFNPATVVRSNPLAATSFKPNGPVATERIGDGVDPVYWPAVWPGMAALTAVASAPLYVPIAGLGPFTPQASVPLTAKAPEFGAPKMGLEPSIVTAEGAFKLMAIFEISYCVTRRAPPRVIASEVIR